MKIKILSLIFLTTLFSLKAQYTTPNTGVKWTLDSIVLHSPSTVTVSGDTYSLLEELMIAENDSLVLDENLTLEIAEGIEVGIEGYFKSDADEITITAIDSENPYEGFWFYDTAEVYFNNTLVEYGGGIRVITPDFLMENSEVSNNTNADGSATGGAISFSNGSPIIRNSTFKNNVHPALSSGANTSVSIQIENCYFEGNNTSNTNAPQINMGPSGESDSTRIINNTVIGNRDLTNVGGISASSLMGVENKISIRGNTVKDNRYGITSMGNSSGFITDNIIEDNNSENAPMNGGSGINLFSTNMIYVTNNEIRRNLWGITLQGTALVNLGSDGDENFNPGGNIFSENENGGVTYALFNNTSNAVEALHNCWIEGQESTADDVENVISHIVDDPELGEVFFDPFECGILMSVDDMNSSDFKIYPNPTKNSFFVESTEKGNLKIYDLNGKLVQTQKNLTGKNQIQVQLTKGIYIVEFESDKTKSTQKLVIQ